VFLELYLSFFLPADLSLVTCRLHTNAKLVLFRIHYREGWLRAVAKATG
jgi:hypothetical protein